MSFENCNNKVIKMCEKDLIGKIRNLTFTTNVDAKAGVPKDAFKIGDQVIAVYENSIYELIFAETIDPKRNISDLPPMFPKLIFEKGANSNIVSKVLLTAKTVFQQCYFQDHINCDKILRLTFEILNEILILYDEVDKYDLKRTKEIENCIARKKQEGTFHLPAIVNLETICKTIYQKADHIEQILMEIIRFFYPNGLSKQSHFPQFYEVIVSKHDETSEFAKFVQESLWFMKVIRCLRNGLDHRLDFVKVENFMFEDCGKIACPTVSLNHKDTKLDRIALVEFFKVTKVNLLNIIEITFANLASYNVRKDSMPWGIKLIPKKDRKNKFVRYSFWLPLGEEGIYLQNS